MAVAAKAYAIVLTHAEILSVKALSSVWRQLILITNTAAFAPSAAVPARFRARQYATEQMKCAMKYRAV